MAKLARKLAAQLARDLAAGADLTLEPIYALTNLGAANYFATQVGGGESGDAGGFADVAVVQVNRLSTGATRYLAGRSNTGDVGHGLYISTSNGLFFGARNGANTTLVQTGQYVLQPSDVGKLLCVVGRHDGSFVRLTVNRDVTPASTAITGFTPAGVAHHLGALGGIAPAIDCAIVLHATYRGVLTDADVRAICEAARDGVLPKTIGAATLVHQWPDRALLKAAAGSTAPASIPDVVTGADVDAMARVGSPTVVAIDTSRDGRRALGAMGFSAANFLQTEPGKGLRGHPDAFWYAMPLRIDQQTGLGAAYRLIASMGTHWDLRTTTTHSTLFATSANGATSAAYTIAASDVSQIVPVLVRYDGAARTFALFVRGILIAGGTAGGSVYGTPAAGTQAMMLGKRADGFASDGASLFGFVGGDGHLPTDAEVAKWFADHYRLGGVPEIPDKTTVRYDFSQDFTAGAVTATVLDRVGTDHLTRMGVALSADGGVTGLSSAAVYQTATGGGIGGVATGFWCGGLLRHDEFFNLPRSLFGRTNLNTAGFDLMLSNASGGIFQARATNGTALTSVSPGVGGGAGATVGRVYDVRLVYDGATLTLYVDGAAVGSVALTGYVPHTGPFYVGVANGATYFASGVTYFGVGGGHAVPTAAEIATAAAASLASKRFVGIAGRTDRLHDFVQDAADLGGVLPGRSVDRMGSGDDLVRVGAPLVLAQRTERGWGCETAPIMRGLSGFSDAAGYVAPASLIGGGGVPFTVGAVFRCEATGGAINGVVLVAGSQGGPTGIQVRFLSGVLYVYMRGPTGDVVTTTYLFAAADIGKYFAVMGSFDGTRLTLYIRRMMPASGALVSALVTDATAPMMVGFHPSKGQNLWLRGATVIGWIFGDAATTLPEYQAWHDACLALETVAAMPGKPMHRYVIANDPAPDSIAPLDGGNGPVFTRSGMPAVVPLHARAWSV